MCAAPTQVKAGLQGGVMGVMVEKTGYPETFAGPDLAVIGGAVR